MKKILLLTTAILLSSASVYSACDPNLPACQCSYPKMVNGIIGCSETYCETGTKCMPDGSCCPNDNYCESTEKGKECCSAEQTCDTANGCVESNSCANGEGSIVRASSGTFCMSNDGMNWYKAEEWCQKYGMTMATLEEMCPVITSGKCLALKGITSDFKYAWSSTLLGSSDSYQVAYYVWLFNNGDVETVDLIAGECSAFCH